MKRGLEVVAIAILLSLAIGSAPFWKNRLVSELEQRNEP